MKTRCPLLFRNVTAFIAFLFVLSFTVFSQQYYNYNTGGAGNNFPFNIYPATGKTIQTLYLPGEFNNPNPVVAGNITKIYFRASGTGNPTFTNLKIRMGLTTDTDLPLTAWYTGTMTTVFDQASYSVSATAGSFFSITLGTPFYYDPAKSLVVEVEQCGFSGTSFAVYTTTTTGQKRHTGPFTAPVPPCPHPWYNTGAFVTHTGIDVTPVVTTCSYSWSTQTSGTTSLLYTVKAVNDLVGWAAGAAGTVRRTTDGGATWGNGNPNPGVITGDIYNIEALDANTAFVTTSPGATFIYKTTNGGTNWVQVYTIAGGFINTIRMVSPTNGFAFGDPLGGNWLMLKTTDGGSTWTTLATIAGTGDGRNNCLHISLPDIWFGTGQGTVWHSTNSGLNWTSATTTGLSGQVTGIQFNTSLIGLVGGSTMAKTTDGGATFALLAALGSGTITGIEGVGDNYWYTRGTGIFFSTNVGASWTQVHTQTAAQNDISLVSGANGCMTGWSAGTSGTISKLTGVPVGINDPISQIPGSFKLEQNYPNPFNPTTSITYALPVTGNVELKVYDVLGKEVATLVNTIVNAGTHIVTFDASSLASGVYIYKISSGSFTDSKKMVLIK